MAKPVSLLIQEQCHLSLQTLCLSRSQICDDTVTQLANSLQSLSHVTRIDLSYNVITHKGLQNFCEVLYPESVKQSNQFYLEVGLVSCILFDISAWLFHCIIKSRNTPSSSRKDLFNNGVKLIHCNHDYFTKFPFHFVVDLAYAYDVYQWDTHMHIQKTKFWQ